jgi:hypothetical protein
MPDIAGAETGAADAAVQASSDATAAGRMYLIIGIPFGALHGSAISSWLEFDAAPKRQLCTESATTTNGHAPPSDVWVTRP